MKTLPDSPPQETIRSFLAVLTKRPQPGECHCPEDEDSPRCPPCETVATWEQNQEERIDLATLALAARMLEMWPDGPEDDGWWHCMDANMAHAIRVLRHDPRTNWPLTVPRRRPINGAVRIAVFERDAYRCVKCGSWEELTVDHVIPVIAGGEHTMENFQTLCGTCNKSKGARQ